MAKKDAEKTDKAAEVTDETRAEPVASGDPAAGTPDEAPDPAAVQVYMVRLTGPGDDHKIVRTKRNGTTDFHRRGPAQRMRLNATEAADLRRKGFDVTAKDKG